MKYTPPAHSNSDRELRAHGVNCRVYSVSCTGNQQGLGYSHASTVRKLRTRYLTILRSVLDILRLWSWSYFDIYFYVRPQCEEVGMWSAQRLKHLLRKFPGSTMLMNGKESVSENITLPSFQTILERFGHILDCAIFATAGTKIFFSLKICRRAAVIERN